MYKRRKRTRTINRIDSKSDRYQKWRRAVINRDEGKCQWLNCKYNGKYINVHHIKTYAHYPQLRYTINNGICLCPKHHKFIKGKEERYEYMFSCIITRKNYDIVYLVEEIRQQIKVEKKDGE